MDQMIRKPMTVHKTLRHKEVVDRLYKSRNEGGNGLARIEDNVYISI